MECFEKQDWTDGSEERLRSLSIDKPDEDVYRKIRTNWDHVAKPIDGLGRLEELTARIGAIQGSAQPDTRKKAVLIFCADNGIVEEGVSQSGQEVTLAVAKSMAHQSSSVGKMAAFAGADTIPVDIGINSKERIPGVLDRKVRPGTRNFIKEPAMTRQETLQAVFTGIGLVGTCKEQGYGLLATGEMGIGNTTTSSAVTAALTGCGVELVTGRGAGLSDAGLHHKIQVIDRALQTYELTGADTLTVLSCVGGLDLAGLAGMCIGGALYHIPIVLDGVISMTAALLAERLVPGVKEYLLASHKGKEPAVEHLLKELSLEAVIDGKLALGEGTGAVMLFSLLDMVLCLYQDSTTFEDIHVQQYERFK